MKPIPLARAVVEHVLGAAVDEVEEVPHGRHLEHLARSLDVVDRHVREAEMPDEALVLERLEPLVGLVAADLRVDAVELVAVDPLEAEPAQAHQQGLAQILSALDGVPRLVKLALLIVIGVDGDAVAALAGACEAAPTLRQACVASSTKEPGSVPSGSSPRVPERWIWS
jgi:hypothetical protein